MITRVGLFTMMFSLVIFPGPIPWALGNIKAGALKSQPCAACHGPDGNSVVTTYPKLAGQNAGYLIKQLLNYKQGAKSGRSNPIMDPLASPLSPQDLEDLAAYYSAQRPTYGSVAANYLATGQLIFRGGIIGRGIPACAACHNPQGFGNALGRIPALAGQHPEYIVQQLQAYKTGQRKSDTNHIMRDIASRMSDAEMQAVASYVSGLH